MPAHARVAPRALLTVALLLGSLAAMPGALAWLPPPPEFPDVTRGSGIDMAVHRWSAALGPPTSLLDLLPAGSAAAGDFNRDGFSDVFVPATRYTDEGLNALRAPSSRLFLNDGSDYTIDGERFIDVTGVSGIQVGGHATSASWADYDGDGWPDLLVGGYRLLKLYRNLGDGTFADATAAAGLPQDVLAMGAAWGDYDRDGDADLALPLFSTYTHPDDGAPASLRDVPGQANRLLRNDGGAFTDVSASSGLGGLARRSTSAVWVDVDRDGDLDLYVTNYGQPAELWVQAAGAFTEGAAPAGIADGADATCQAWEDLDRDGLLDLVVPHQDGVRDGLWLARGDGTFLDATATPGWEHTAQGSGWGCTAFDYDADGDIDVFVAQAGPLGARERDVLLTNRLEDGGLAFVDTILEAGDNDAPGYETYDTLLTARADSGLLAWDFNLDSAADLLTSNNDRDDVRLFKNIGWAGGWAGGNGNHFKVWLQGAGDRDARGALVTVQAGTLTITRQLGSQASWGGSALTELQFGISKPEEAGYERQSKPVNITIQWPSGAVDAYLATFSASRTARFYEGAGWQNDTLAPRPLLSLVSGTEGANGWYTSPTVQLRLTAGEVFNGGSLGSGVQSLRYRLPGGAWTNVASPAGGVVLTFAGQGTHKVWVEAVDKAGNRAVTLYPVRIDTGAPSLAVEEPVPGTVHAQGREVARASPLAPAGRAVVAAPLAFDAGPLGKAGAPLGALLGSDGTQPVRASAADAVSGVHSVGFRVLRANGQVPEHHSAVVRHAPYVWAWPAELTAAGEYRVEVTATDAAGHATTVVHKVLLAPTGPEGVQSTVRDGPSLPTTT